MLRGGGGEERGRKREGGREREEETGRGEREEGGRGTGQSTVCTIMKCFTPKGHHLKK